MLLSYSKVILILIFLFSLTNAEYVIARKDNPTQKDISKLVESGYDIASSRVNKFIDIVITEEEYFKIRDIYNLHIIDTEEKMNSRFSTDRQSDNGYMTYNTYVSKLNELRETYSDIMKVYDVGDSEGKKQGLTGYEHDIWLIKISDNVDEQEAEPGYMFAGEHHARETQTFPATYAILKHLLTNYNSDPKVTEYVNNNQIYLVPLVNPNGYTVARTKNSMWRKNANLNGSTFNPNYSFGQGSSVGVDLNRNYEFQWGVGSSSPSKTAETYRGPYALSESETTIMDSLMDCLNIQASISFHSYSEVILVPFSYSQWASPADNTELRALALDMADEMKDSWGRPYEVGNAEGLLGYGAGGGMSDHMYANYGVFAYCFELWTSFQTPEGSLPGLTSMCVNAAEIMLDRSNYKTLRGIVTLNEEPVKAKVELSSIDDNTGERTDYYSYEETGLYVRFIPAGTYTLTVTLDSYPDSVRVIEDVVIQSNDVTVLDVPFGEVVEPDTLEITFPSEGDIIEQGTICSINWNNRVKKGIKPLECETVSLSLYNDDDFILGIIDSLENNGSFSWPVDSILDSDTMVPGYKIKISSIDDPTVYDYSDEFLIHNDMTAKTELVSIANLSLKINGIENGFMNLSIPTKGYYKLKLYSLNGKIIYNWKGVLDVGNCNVNLCINKVCNQVLIADLSGVGISTKEKIIFR